MKESATFWLSETPDQLSRGWDAAIRRICTYVRLTDRKSGQTLLVLNTHFDHVGVEARKKSAELLIKKIKDLSENNPVVLLGDFNATPDSEPITLLKSELTEARLAAANVDRPEPGSFNAFNVSKPADQLIDQIFVSPTVSVSDYRVIVEQREGRYPSDHFPVVSEISFH